MTGTRRFSIPLSVGIGIVVAAIACGPRVGALFSSTATATIDLVVEVPVVPRPATVACSTGGTILVARWAAFSWTHPTGGVPQPTEYVIRVLDDGDEVEVARVPGSSTSHNLRSSSFVGALAGLLAALLGGSTQPVSVNAVYNGFESPTVFTHHLRGELGLLSGIGCGPGATP